MGVVSVRRVRSVYTQMSQTRFFRAVFYLRIGQRLRLLWYGRVAVSATILPKEIRDTDGGIFTQDDDAAARWIRTGSTADEPTTPPSVARDVLH